MIGNLHHKQNHSNHWQRVILVEAVRKEQESSQSLSGQQDEVIT